MNATVLVTGAAGGLQGSTGTLVTRMLLDRGVPVRAFVRRDDERAQALRDLGAEVVLGDLREIATVRPAMRGIRRAFFTYPVREGLLGAAAVFAVAAEEAGVEQVVEVSQLVPAPDAGTPRMRQHWVAEQVFDRFGVGAVHLRATVFFENIRTQIDWEADPAELALPLGGEDTAIPLVAAEDVARVAAGILAAHRVHEPGALLLVGELTSVRGIADTFADALGRPLRYTDLPDQAWHDAFLARGFEPHAADHLTSLWQILRAGGPAAAGLPLYQVTEAIERLGGQPPQSFRQFLHDRSDARERLLPA